jgi:hypothetical protein
MKKIFVPILLASAVFMSCDNNDPQPIRQKLILPLRLELDDFHREFTFDKQNRISVVKSKSFYPNEVTLESTTEYFYSPDNKLERTVTDTGFRLEYTYEGDKVIRTDEYIDDDLSQYHTFSYDGEGNLQDFTTWQDIPELGLTPKSKEVYVYDNSDNLSHVFLYYFDTGINGHALLTSFEYSDYDNHPEAESQFDTHVYNPYAVYKKNNPGKVITKNRLGNIGMIDTYSYVYDARGKVVEKTTHVTYPYNGNSGSYKTRYFYQER